MVGHVEPAGPAPGAEDHRAPRVTRRVVSFVRRSPRMTPSQRQALEQHGARYLLDLPRAELDTQLDAGVRIDPEAVFGRRAPLAVEIGPGTGESLVAMAAARPEWNVLGFEVFSAGLAATLHRLADARLSNVRLISADGAAALRTALTGRVITQLWTFFPDPWHKTRHHKRRLVSPEFAELVATRLVPGGVWRLATDWTDYAESMREVLDAAAGLVRADPEGADDPAAREPLRPTTHYERRGLAAGRRIHELTYRAQP